MRIYNSRRWRVPLTAVLMGAFLSASSYADEHDSGHEVWRSDESVHMIAIEALVVEVNEDRTRDLGVHVAYTRDRAGTGFHPVTGLPTGSADAISSIVQGADVVFGRTLSPVDVARFDPQFPFMGFNDLSSGIPNIKFDENRLPGLGFTVVGLDVDGGTIAATLRAFLDQGEARIVTRPLSLALNNTKTFVHVGSEVPYQDVAVEGSRDKPVVAFEKVGVDLEIIPSIVDLASRTVELNITQVKVSSVSQFIVTPVQNAEPVERPVFNSAETRTKITMREGETYLISSLKSRRSRTLREGIPFLMNIPFLGHFFSSRSEVFQGVDILFFITVYVIPPGENVVIPFDFAHGQDLIEQGVNLNQAQQDIFGGSN